MKTTTYEIHFTDWTHAILDLTEEQYNDLMKKSHVRLIKKVA